MEKQLEILIIMFGISTVVQLLVAFTNRYNTSVERRILKLEHEVFDHDGDVRSSRHHLANEITGNALKIAAIEKVLNGWLKSHP